VYNKIDAGNTISILTQKLYNDFVKPEDQKLLNLVFSTNPTQHDLDELLKVWDIEAKGIHLSLILVYFMKERPELKVTDYEAPRLKGLLYFHKFANMKILAQFAKVGKALNDARIPLVLFKGGAMRFLRPELPRIMGDVDFLVPAEKFDQVVDIAKTFGFSQCNKHAADHSLDMATENKKVSIDIHKYLSLGLEKDKEYFKKFNGPLLERAARVNAFGADVLIPSAEDFMFIVLANLIKNITEKTSVSNVLFSLFDCKFLISQKNHFNWDIIIENAQLTNTLINVRLAIAFINRIAPKLLPDELTEKFPMTKEMKAYFNRVVYNEIYFFEFRDENRALKIKQVWQKPRLLPKYFKMKPKYFFMKQIRDIPFFVDLYLRRQHAHT
jgi:hypothetical protein